MTIPAELLRAYDDAVAAQTRAQTVEEDREGRAQYAAASWGLLSYIDKLESRVRELEADAGLARPPGCVCRPADWADPHDIDPICGTYNRGATGDCHDCYHEEGCHHG